MEDTLITFETAKLAKEKGLCEYFKNINPTKYVQAYYSEDKITFKESEYMQEDCVIEDRYFRPTQSLLAKWLRENYNLHVVINIGLPHNCSIMYYCNVVKFGKHHKSKFKSIFYKTYEDAHEIGLQEALKLINIIK